MRSREVKDEEANFCGKGDFHDEDDVDDLTGGGFFSQSHQKLNISFFASSNMKKSNSSSRFPPANKY